MSSIAGVHKPNATTHEWITPKHILDALGLFDLDPCESVTQPWPCATNGYAIERGQDGLALPWYGRVWLNPPYGEHTALWLDKMSKHKDGIALVFARTDTEMFQRHVFERASAILFLEGRLHFHYPDGRRAKHNSGGPSCLIAWNTLNTFFLRQSRLPGKIVCL